MTEDFNFKKYGAVDAGSLQQKVIAAAFDWDAFTFRQETYKVHRETRTVPLIYDETNFFHLKVREQYAAFEPEIEAIQKIIEDGMQEKGRVRIAVLIKLDKHATIYPHMDKGPFFKITHRFHIPVFTNPGCLFTVDNETINMKEGEIWEINNDNKIHSVENKGDTDRIHLVIDWSRMLQ